MPSGTDVVYQDLDYYEILDVDPEASPDQLRSAFRRAVLRHHPDRSGSPASLATRRTSLLNRAWSELRDPALRRQYDGALARGEARTLAWPVASGEPLRGSVRRARRAPRGQQPAAPSPWHQPAWRSVAGFRVPAAVYRDDPETQREWIVSHYIEGEDWHDHRERYWLRFAAAYYRDHGRLGDRVGTLERLVEVDPAFDTLARAGLREAYQAADRHLEGATFLAETGERWPPTSAPREWVVREQRALLADYRERHVRRGPAADRAANADLLLDYLAGVGLDPTVVDLRAAHLAYRRAARTDSAAAVLERIMAERVTDGDGWYTRVQLLTEAGELDRASALLAGIARGEHPAALDPRQVRGQPSVRIARARTRLVRAQERRNRSARAGRAG